MRAPASFSGVRGMMKQRGGEGAEGREKSAGASGSCVACAGGLGRPRRRSHRRRGGGVPLASSELLRGEGKKTTEPSRAGPAGGLGAGEVGPFSLSVLFSFYSFLFCLFCL